jgi:GT2 family glycosyltransferase
VLTKFYPKRKRNNGAHNVLMFKHMVDMSLAVLLTCHNRRIQTCDCLNALKNQGADFDVFLVDDGSSDGTAEAVSRDFPNVKIIQGSGNLFWVGGMRLAFAEALKVGYDNYLWLNDDTLLKHNAIAELLDYRSQLIARNCANSILVGSTKDSLTDKPTYGGAVRSKRWYSNKFELLSSSDELQECETMFGNCVLIPSEVSDLVGNIDDSFIHSLGDLDYGLRARQKGCSIWVAPGYIGYCSQNEVTGSWVDTDLSVLKRLQKAMDAKGFPLGAWTTFVRRHSGPFWMVFWFLPYIRAIISYQDLEASPSFTASTTQKKPQSS